MDPASIQHFSWDGAKAQANECKHGITFQLARTVFRDRSAVVVHDGRYDSGDEDRWHFVGVAEGGPLLVVVCNFDEANGNEHARIISARRATTRERREYETGEYTVRDSTEEYGVTQNIEAEDDSDMKAEYDFSKGVRGRFAHWRLPVYVENSILGYFHERAIATGVTGDALINEVLRQHVAAAGYVHPVFKGTR